MCSRSRHEDRGPVATPDRPPRAKDQAGTLNLRVVGVDLADEKLKAEWLGRQRPNLQYVTVEPGNLPFADAQFDMGTAIESLEHVTGPRAHRR